MKSAWVYECGKGLFWFLFLPLQGYPSLFPILTIRCISPQVRPCFHLFFFSLKEKEKLAAWMPSSGPGRGGWVGMQGAQKEWGSLDFISTCPPLPEACPFPAAVACWAVEHTPSFPGWCRVSQVYPPPVLHHVACGSCRGSRDTSGLLAFGVWCSGSLAMVDGCSSALPQLSPQFRYSPGHWSSLWEVRYHNDRMLMNLHDDSKLWHKAHGIEFIPGSFLSI